MRCKIFSIWIISILVFTNTSYSQPPGICSDPPSMTSFCEDACIICDIDGFTGRHNSNISGWLPPDFCTSTVHNSQWIAFIAGSENLKIELSVSNCNRGWGLEMTIYESRDCKTFQKVFNCNGDVLENTRQIFTNTRPLTIGQYYYLTMDGNGGDNCNWTFKVLEGTTKVSPLENSGEFNIPDVVCEQTPVPIELKAPVGSTEFYWSINNNDININKKSFDYTFTQIGEYNVCVYVANACDQAPPICKKVTVLPIPNTIIDKTICKNDCLVFPDTTICEEGFHQLLYPLPIGCDSIVNVFLKKIEQPVTHLKATICNGDTIFIDDLPFTTTTLTKVNIDRMFCDSIVTLDLRTIECNIEGNSLIKDALCYQSVDGQMNFQITNGTPPFQYRVKDFFGNSIKNGIVDALFTDVLVTGFSKGTYFIEIEDNFGNTEILINEISEPSPLMTSGLMDDFNDFQVSCFGGNDGKIEMHTTGGTPPYTYTWSNGDKKNPVNHLTAGNYKLTITDDNGCPLVKEFLLIQPTALSLTLKGENPECDDLTTGKIDIIHSAGGIVPYSYSIDNVNFKEGQLSFNNLISGDYQVYVKDANGCLFLSATTLVDPEIPQIVLPSSVEIELGDSLWIDAVSNLDYLKSIEWQGRYLFTCDTCLTTNYFPYTNSVATLQLISIDDCIDVDSILIRVKNNRHVYFANIFNINSPVNNVFALQLGKGVKDIRKFNVYDRWGNLVHQEMNLHSFNYKGWDGKLNGTECALGVYVWMAEIQYLDDTIESFLGDVTLIK